MNDDTRREIDSVRQHAVAEGPQGSVTSPAPKQGPAAPDPKQVDARDLPVPQVDRGPGSPRTPLPWTEWD